MSNRNKTIFVYADWEGLGGATLLGTLNTESIRGNEVFSFTDDHLRNHGFILTKSGWELSPAYDINANPDGRGLSLNISENDNSLDFNLLLEQIKYYKLPSARANEILGGILSVVSRWKQIAEGYGLSRTSINQMERAFK